MCHFPPPFEKKLDRKPHSDTRAVRSANEVTVLTTFASFADVRFSNNTSDHLEAILKTERQREITKVTARGTT